MARPGAREVGGEAGSAITCRWSANPIVGKFLKLPMCTAHAAATPTAPAATAAEPGTRPYGRAGNGAVEASRQRRRTAVELTRAFESAHTKRSTRNFGLGGQHVRRRRTAAARRRRQFQAKQSIFYRNVGRARSRVGLIYN